jgi:hypothetical protein
MSNIKFYTEEQVKKALNDCGEYFIVNMVLEKMKPIELPSEHEIEESSFKMSGNNVSPSSNFMIGAYWMKEKYKEVTNDIIFNLSRCYCIYHFYGFYGLVM